MPYTPLPNIKTFEVKKLHSFHPVLELLGIKLRVDKAEFSTIKGSNTKINKYLKYMFKLLNKKRLSSREFWCLGSILLKSLSFKLSLLTKIYPCWYKSHSMKDILAIIGNYNGLDLDNYTYKKVMIQKSNGKWRPLGVPTSSWRMYQSGLNQLLLVYTSTIQHPDQHGFIPGRGTDTAWQSIHKSVLKSTHIYEFDLKEFFDRVNLDHLGVLLSKIGLPNELTSRLQSWSRSSPTNAESSTDLTWTNPEEKWTTLSQHKHLTNQLDREKGYSYYHGVAQGSPLSPTLSTLVLIPNLLLHFPGIVQYADDGLIYSNEKDFNPELILANLNPLSGIQSHVTAPKSQYIKRANVWQLDLKFLGKRFEPWSLHPENKHLTHTSGGIIANATRTPKEFKFTQSDIFTAAVLYDKLEKSNPSLTFKELIKLVSDKLYSEEGLLRYVGKGYIRGTSSWVRSKYYGFISSRIYAGSLKLPAYPIKNDLTENPYPGSYLYKAQPVNHWKDSPTWNRETVSSYATTYLALKLRKELLDRSEFTNPINM